MFVVLDPNSDTGSSQCSESKSGSRGCSGGIDVVLLPVKNKPFSHVIPILIFLEKFTAWVWDGEESEVGVALGFVHLLGGGYIHAKLHLLVLHHQVTDVFD